MIKISVIITSYNYSEFLRECIESVLVQKYPDVELIVVDDNSLDDSATIISDYSTSNVKGIVHNINKGHGAAFNSGYYEATGDILVFLDADDYMAPNSLSTINDVYDENIAQYQFRMNLVDEMGKYMDIFPQRTHKLDSGMIAELLLNNGRYSTTVTSGLAFNPAILRKVMPIDEAKYRQGADGYLTSTVPLFGEVKSFDEILSSYRQHGDNHSKFSQKLLDRAKWCLKHDEYRYSSLRKYASKYGYSTKEPLGDRDILNIEQRLVLLLFNSVSTKNYRRRITLSLKAVYVSNTLNLNGIRKTSKQLWLLLVGFMPRSLAKKIIQWGLDSASRPYILTSFIKILRKANI